jgi:hypothetical protein
MRVPALTESGVECVVKDALDRAGMEEGAAGGQGRGGRATGVRLLYRYIWLRGALYTGGKERAEMARWHRFALFSLI